MKNNRKLIMSKTEVFIECGIKNITTINEKINQLQKKLTEIEAKYGYNINENFNRDSIHEVMVEMKLKMNVEDLILYDNIFEVNMELMLRALKSRNNK